MGHIDGSGITNTSNDGADRSSNNSYQFEICCYCDGKGRLEEDLLSRNLPIRTCPICKGIGKISGPQPYFTQDGYLSVEIANRLRASHGSVTEIDLLDFGNSNLINVELFFEDGKHFRLGGFAVGYEGTRPELFAKLVRNAGFHITVDEYLKMATPGSYFHENQSSDFIMETGLLWQAECDGIVRTHAEAVNYCAHLTLANLQRWRLPTLEEYQLLSRQLESDYHDFWTASFEPDLADDIAYIDDGTTMFLKNQYHVRAVHEISFPLTWILNLVRSQSTEQVLVPMPPPVPKSVTQPAPAQEELIEPYRALPAESNIKPIPPSEKSQKDEGIPTPPIHVDALGRSDSLPKDKSQMVAQGTEIQSISPPKLIQPQGKSNKKKFTNELSGLGTVLAILITVVLTIILTLIFVPSLPAQIVGNQGDIVDFAGSLGSIFGMICGLSTLVGPITYGIMTAIFPKKTQDSKMTINAIGTNPGVIPPPQETKVTPSQKGSKIRTAALILILLIGLFVVIVSVGRKLATGAPTGYQSGGTNSGEVINGCVTASSLRIRTGPGTDYSVVKGLSQGECLAFDGRDASSKWIRISNEDSIDSNQSLWVSAEYVAMNEDISILPIVMAP